MQHSFEIAISKHLSKCVRCSVWDDIDGTGSVCAYTASHAGNQTQRKQTQSLMITLVKPSAPNSKPLEGDVSLAVFFYLNRCVLDLTVHFR